MFYKYKIIMNKNSKTISLVNIHPKKSETSTKRNFSGFNKKDTPSLKKLHNFYKHFSVPLALVKFL